MSQLSPELESWRCHSTWTSWRGSARVQAV